jgi:hypothetical protein
MNLHQSTLQLVLKEKEYTAKIIQNLIRIDHKKLYCDWKYPTLFKYLTKGLGYTEAEANVRVGAVRFARREKSVVRKISQGSLSLSNAALAESVSKKNSIPPKKIIPLIENKSTRQAKEALRQKFNPEMPRREMLALDERMLAKLDRLKQEYGDLSSYELIDCLLEEKLKAPRKPVRPRNVAAKNSRYIPKAVKHKVYSGKCNNCGTRRNLQYDHRHEFSLGGDNSADNIQLLCWGCNQRKEIKRASSVP